MKKSNKISINKIKNKTQKTANYAITLNLPLNNAIIKESPTETHLNTDWSFIIIYFLKYLKIKHKFLAYTYCQANELIIKINLDVKTMKKTQKEKLVVIMTRLTLLLRGFIQYLMQEIKELNISFSPVIFMNNYDTSKNKKYCDLHLFLKNYEIKRFQEIDYYKDIYQGITLTINKVENERIL